MEYLICVGFHLIINYLLLIARPSPIGHYPNGAPLLGVRLRMQIQHTINYHFQNIYSPINVLRRPIVRSNCAETPKSTSFTSALSVSNTF